MDSGADARYAVGTSLPEISLLITYQKIVMTPMATWDLFPGHNDPFYAQRQGQKSIYLNTVVLQGFADRVVTDWAGPAVFIARRKMIMKASVYPDDVLTGSGRIVRSETYEGKHSMDLAMQLRTQAASVCDVETTIILPQGNSDVRYK